MLSLQDCLDYCDLSEDEVCLIAHHEHLPFPCAAQLAFSLLQDGHGEETVRCMLEEELTLATRCGRDCELVMAQKAYAHFNQHHPPCGH